MSATRPTSSSNAQRRAAVLAHIEAKLMELWPDGEPSESRRTFADFDALEAAATQSGDGLARMLMEEGLEEALKTPGEDRPEYCETCGRKLQWSQRKHGLQTIRGPVVMERSYGYCRACRRGFFPLRRALPARKASAERAPAAGPERTR